MIHFITGNKGKFEEAKAILDGPIEQLDIDLPEIQDIDPHKIIKAKLEAAFEHHPGPFIVDDTSLLLESLDYQLPGPLIKWFLVTIGSQGMYEVCKNSGKFGAKAIAFIGYAKDKNNIEFFEGVVNGRIEKPREGAGFGWDPIFIPEGFDQSFAEMEPEVKNSCSHRRKALDKLKTHLAK